MIGQQLGPYLIEAKLGAGGMGVVYKATDTRLLRPVAVKILPQHLVADEKNRLRLTQEARAASALNHPNICTVHDIGEEKGINYIVMEFVEGRTLREILEERDFLSEGEVIELGLKVCDALAAAHEKGIIHRDIKPDNVMLSKDGGVKVMDFGLAKLLASEDAQLQTSATQSLLSSKKLLKTSVSTFQGTATYMSPEQIEKRKIDGRTDVFSVGVLLYELLTGIPPFAGRDSVAVMKAILKDEPRPVTEMVPNISLDVDAAVMKALGKRPDARHASAAAMREVLRKSTSEFMEADPQNSRHGILGISKYSTKLWLTISTTLIAVLSLTFYFGTALNSAKSDITAKPKTRTYPLVTSPYYENLPAISPDGSQVAYVSDQSGNFDIWVKELDGTEAINLTKSFDGLDTEPAWSPDGTEIVFRSERNGGGLFVKSLVTTQVRQISDFGEAPGWSPDNKLIAFVSKDVNMSAPSKANLSKLENPARVTANPRHGTKPCV